MTLSKRRCNRPGEFTVGGIYRGSERRVTAVSFRYVMTDVATECTVFSEFLKPIGYGSISQRSDK